MASDTVAYNDEDELAKIGKTPDKITAIRVWSSKYIVGMEVFYDGISAGARMGSEYLKGVVYQDLTLGPGEDIKVVKGRSGDLIDRIEFKTTKGRTVSFGTSTGGKKFKLKDPAGRLVRGFKVGFGGHLHHIGVYFAHKDHTPKTHTFPAPTPAPVPIGGMGIPTPAPAPVPIGGSTTTTTTTKTKGFGGVTITTKKTTTSGGIPAPTPVGGIPAPVPVGGIPAPTPVGGIPAPTPVGGIPAPTPVGGIPAPTPVGGIPTPAPVPTTTTPAAGTFSIGGFTVTTAATPPAPAPMPTPAPAPAPAATYIPPPMPVIPTFTQSNVAGKTHADTVKFNDYTTHKASLTSSGTPRLAELRVLHDNDLVFGLEAIYEAGGVQFSGGQHAGNEMNHNTVNQSIPLAVGETITKISGKHGNVIDSMTVTTSLGKIYTFGGTGGSFSYSLFIPSGKTVTSIAGGTGGHLHNFSVYYV
eukprot:CAMPEP_0197003528 /NCGR_PEP_ID=MMETSP1380-20130617/7758_1 /TAXON_ID=5936 /ORGANISM="Euplotes crassus, Strain CT5" /LENGTH=468 /DNA_ID=CAMNT_0042422051 /DNA_START=49 /DNA_END=1456 /DNA_ORIENTATION=-